LTHSVADLLPNLRISVIKTWKRCLNTGKITQSFYHAD
jgi:hypothetical protein